LGSPTESMEKVIRVSRERYALRRSDIEDKIMRWSGLAPAEESGDDEDGEDERPVKEKNPIGSRTSIAPKKVERVEQKTVSLVALKPAAREPETESTPGSPESSGQPKKRKRKRRRGGKTNNSNAEAPPQNFQKSVDTSDNIDFTDPFDK